VWPSRISYGVGLLGIVVAAFSLWVQWRSASEQAANAHTAMVLEYSPQVVVQGAQLDLKGASPRINVFVANTGKTPALNVSAFYKIRWENVPHVEHGAITTVLPELEFEGETTLFGRDFQSVMIAGDKGIVVVNPMVQPQYVPLVKNGFRPLSADGHIGYRDSFGQAHRTYFCYTSQLVGGQLLLVACARNNQTDTGPSKYVGAETGTEPAAPGTIRIAPLEQSQTKPERKAN